MESFELCGVDFCSTINLPLTFSIVPMKSFLRLVFIVLVFATTGLFAQAAYETAAGLAKPHKIAKVVKKTAKKHKKHKKKAV